jgi:tetratricopeptide (TPR) repeat protein
MLGRRLFGLVLAAGCAISAPAQNMDVTAKSQLTVQILYDNDRKAPKDLRVELLTSTGGLVESQTTDGFRPIVFLSLTPGDYKIRVTGSGIEPTTTGPLPVSGANHTEFVRVKAEPQESGSPTEEGPFSISTTELAIPEKAKKEFDEGTKNYDRKQWKEAREHFERATALYPKYAAAYNNLGVAYMNMGERDKATESFRAALALDEHIADANLNMGHMLYDDKKYKEAEPFLSRALTADPLNPQLLTALANAELQNGELDLALASARKVHSVPNHQKFAISHLIAAQVFESRSSSKEAAEEYKLFLQEDPQSPLAPRVKEALGRIEAAP